MSQLSKIGSDAIVMLYPEIVLPRLRYRFCPMCREALAKKILNDDDLERVCCLSCGWVHYPTNAMGVIIIVAVEDRIVAILPPSAPKEYPAALPGGHGEYGESPEEAAVREAYEETGFHVAVTELLGWGFNKNAGYPGPMLHFYYEAKAIGGSAKDSEEGRVHLYRPDQFPPISPQRGGSRRTMELYLERKKYRSPL